ncbi:hypothetical protein SME10J_41410 [Serratia marcescens]|nr:hypothetical protein SME10J_41410 [Serratia marcescens]
MFCNQHRTFLCLSGWERVVHSSLPSCYLTHCVSQGRILISPA